MSKLTCQTKLDNLTNLNTKLEVEDVEIETKKRNMEKKINKSIEVLEEMKKHYHELIKHDQETKNYDLNEIENLIVYMRQSKMKNFIVYLEHSIKAENVSMSNKDKKDELNLADAFFDNSIYSLEKTLKKDRIALKNIIKINNKKAKEADIKAKDKAKKKEIAKIKAQLKALADDKANKSVDEEIKAAEIKAAEIKAAEIKAAAEAKAKVEAEVKEKAERKARAEANKTAKAKAKAEVEARIKAKLKQRHNLQVIFYLLNLDLDKEEFITLTYADIEPFQVSAKTSKYTEYNKIRNIKKYSIKVSRKTTNKPNRKNLFILR